MDTELPGDDDEVDLAEELRLIRLAIERYRRSTFYSFVLSSLTVVALVLSVTVGIIAWHANQTNERRDAENLEWLVRVSCEDANQRTIRNAEALIETVVGPDTSPETIELIEEYRKNTQDSLTNCDERVAIVAGD